MFAATLSAFALSLTLNLGEFSYSHAGGADAKGRVWIEVIAGGDGLSSGTRVTIEGDGRTQKKTLPAVRAGKAHRVTWTQRSTQANYTVRIDAGDGDASFEFSAFKPSAKGGSGGAVKRLTTVQDIKAKRARWKAGMPIEHYEVRIYNHDAQVISETEFDGNIKPGQTFEYSWDTDEAVFLIELNAGAGQTDDGGWGQWVEDKTVTWAIDVPHRDVNFDSAKWNIKPPTETKKVDDAAAIILFQLKRLEQANEIVQTDVKPRLYVVGYTDTVGNGADNQKLSENRARSIAQAFHDRGIWAEIHYAGMGERGLKVQTGDNVDEIRNRRALYLLTHQKPAAGGEIPGRWRQLSPARDMPPGFEAPPLPAWYAEEHGEPSGGGGKGNAGDKASGSGPVSVNTGTGLEEEGAGDAAADAAAGDGGPAPVSGAPGASAKGCTSATPVGFAWAPLLGLGALARRRRRR